MCVYVGVGVRGAREASERPEAQCAQGTGKGPGDVDPNGRRDGHQCFWGALEYLPAMEPSEGGSASEVGLHQRRHRSGVILRHGSEQVALRGHLGTLGGGPKALPWCARPGPTVSFPSMAPITGAAVGVEEKRRGCGGTHRGGVSIHFPGSRGTSGLDVHVGGGPPGYRSTGVRAGIAGAHGELVGGDSVELAAL